MLGMFTPNAVKSCDCKVHTGCEQSDCECTTYCQLFYDDLKEYGKKGKIVYFTISPNTRDFTNPQLLYKGWLDKLYKLSKKCYNFIIVFEKANQLHIHGVADVSDIKGWDILMYKYKIYNNIKEHGKFKHGMHYLFKSVHATFQSLGETPVLVKEDLEAYHLTNKTEEQLVEEKKRRERKLIAIDKEVATIPLWMLE